MSDSHTFTGAELLGKALSREGVEFLSGIPGGVVLGLYDKLNAPEFSNLHHILPRHEQGGGFAADGYARSTGKVGVAIGTSGPGAVNLMNPIVNSMMDSVPVVYITGQVMDNLIGTDAFQEADVVGMSLPHVKHSYYVNKAEDVQRVTKEAFHIARSGRPGPVHVDFAKDVWLAQAEDSPEVAMNLPASFMAIPTSTDSDTVKQLEKLLEAPGTKPVIIAGHGVEIAGAQSELLEFAERHSLPVVSTILGLGSFPQGHALWAGMIGMHGDAVANYVVAEANLVIGIGIRFDDRITGTVESFIENTKFVHFEIDPSEMNKIVPVEVPVLGDLKTNLTLCNQALSAHTYPEWWNSINSLKQQYGFLNVPEYTGNYLSQGFVVDAISQHTNGEAILGVDVGRHQMWAARFYRHKYPRSHLSSGGLGCMGYSIPAAMGAAVGNPDREVWTVTGDGGFMMNVQELGTLAEHNIPVHISIMEDSSLGMVRQWQDLLFAGNLSSSQFKNPDFVKLADAFGIPAWRVTTKVEAHEAIKAARAVNGPTLISFVVDPNEHIFPMVPPNTSLANQALSKADL